MYTSPDDLLLSNLDNTLGGVEKRASVLFFGKIIRVPHFTLAECSKALPEGEQ